MPRFKIGDRVQLVGDIARFYAFVVGVVVQGEADPASVLNQYAVRLADGTVAAFFDFQLQTPPATVAQIIFDSAVSPKGAGSRPSSAVRQVRLLARDIDILLQISGSGTKTILGRVAAGAMTIPKAVVTLLAGDQATRTITSDNTGEFTLRDVVGNKVAMEILVPSRRIIVSLTI